jgi:hypothetical protein
MKANSKLSELTLEELMKKKKQSKSAAIGLGIVMVIACIILITLAIKNSSYALIGVAIGSSISFLPMWIALNQIDEEIKSRV